MKLWSLQPREVFDQIQSEGLATAKPNFEQHWGQSTNAYWGFKQAYDWMAQQMASRIGAPPAGTCHPMWAWARPPSPTKRGAPDLRTMRDDQPGVMLELEVDSHEMLLSDHGSWHHVLNGWALDTTELLADQRGSDLRCLCLKLGHPLGKHGRLDACHFALPEIQSMLSQSWQLIFNITPLVEGVAARLDVEPDSDADAWIGTEDIHVQACLWSIQKKQILSATPYAPRPPRKTSKVAL
jgi:hypothetical protein